MNTKNMKSINNLSQIIEVNPDVKDGQACFKGTRIPVSYIMGFIANGWSVDALEKEYRRIPKGYIRHFIKLIANNIGNETEKNKTKQRIYGY